jgi:hypothetical protein
LLELTARVGTRGTEARVGLALAGKDADA